MTIFPSFLSRIEYTPTHTQATASGVSLAQRLHVCARSFIAKTVAGREVDGTQPFNNCGMLEFAGVKCRNVCQRLVG